MSVLNVCVWCVACVCCPLEVTRLPFPPTGYLPTGFPGFAAAAAYGRGFPAFSPAGYYYPGMTTGMELLQLASWYPESHLGF